MIPPDHIQTTVSKIAIGMRIVFENGMVAQRMPDEDFDLMTGWTQVALEEGAVPFVAIDGSGVFLVPGDQTAWLKPDIPQAFTDAMEGDYD